MAETTKTTSFILTVSFDAGMLQVRAGTSLAQADYPNSWLSLANREEQKTAIVVEILKKLTVALEEGGDGIDLSVDGRIIRKSPSFAPAVVSREVAAQGPLIDLNQAPQKDLETLPGVGPTLAALIIEKRPYRAVEDLRRVWGIGAAKMAEIRPLVRV